MAQKGCKRGASNMTDTAIDRMTPAKILARATLIFTPLALASMLVFYLLYSTQVTATQRVIASGQKQLVEVGFATLTATLAAINNDVQFVSDEPVLRRWLDAGNAIAKEVLLTQYRSFAEHRAQYDQVRFIGTDGLEKVRVNWNSGKPEAVSDGQLRDMADQYYVSQSLKLDSEQAYFSPFDLSTANGEIEQPIKPMIRVGAPVFDSAGVKRGIVVLNYLGQRALDRVRRLSADGLGEAWLVDTGGHWLLGPSAADEWGFMYPDRGDRTFARAYPEAWSKISGAHDKAQFSIRGDLFSYAAIAMPEGSFTGKDTLSPGDTTPSWYLVTRTPAAAYSATGLKYVAALAAVLALLGGIAWALAHHGERRRQAERLVLGLNQRLARDNVQLENVNRELESFSYSVSHDLRTPLRAIDGFSKALLEDYADALDDGGRDYLMRVRRAAQRMGHLIDDLLKLARVSRSELSHDTVDLSLLARRIAAELQQRDPERAAEITIAPNVSVSGDARLLQIVLENLLENAWKFTSRRSPAMIGFGDSIHNGETVYFVRDNGAGFDMTHASKLFGVFQRLHAMTEFEGTGIGLATVQRIIYKHGGRVWGEAEKDRGATFFFTL
jgi:signal transduction histidine kinase